MSNLISVVVPLFNKEKWVARCIESVIRQAYSNIEILVVNDGSTDRSTEIVNSFTDDRIRLINRQNHGRSATRNYGIDQAKGEFVLFLDADDEITPEHTETLSRGFALDPDVIAVADCIVETFNGVRQAPPKPFADSEYQDLDGKKYIILEEYIKTFADRYFLLTTSNTMVRRAILNEHSMRFLETAEPAEDCNLWIRLSRLGKFAYSNFVGAYYHHDDPESVMMGENPVVQFVPPYLAGLQFDQFSKPEISNLKQFLRWEYLKKAYQNQSKPCVREELRTQFYFIDIGWRYTLPYMFVRFMPIRLLSLFRN